MATDEKTCPICGGEASRTHVIGGPDVYQTDCQECRKFIVEATLPKYVWEKLDANGKQHLSYLKTYIGQENQKGNTPTICGQNWRHLAQKGCQLARSTSSHRQIPA